jgi:hypothetical protein
MKLYLVGQFEAKVKEGIVWEFQGIFDSREKALAACRDSNYCIQSVELNESLPHGQLEFQDSEYPIPPQVAQLAAKHLR